MTFRELHTAAESETLEQWKPVKGYEGLYEVSSQGRVFSIKRQKYLKPTETDGGGGLIRHNFVNLYKDGKYKYCGVHRLVAIAFLPNPKNLEVVNHKDGNKHNNTVDNLEWCTQKENVAHALRMGLREQARMRRRRRREEEKWKHSQKD